MTEALGGIEFDGETRNGAGLDECAWPSTEEALAQWWFTNDNIATDDGYTGDLEDEEDLAEQLWSSFSRHK